MFRLPCDPSDRGVSTFPFPGPAGGPFRSVISLIPVAGVVYPRRHWYTRLKSNSLSLNLACFTSQFLSSSSSSLSSSGSRLAPFFRSGAVGVGFPVARRAKHPCRISPTPCQKSRETRRHGFPLDPSSWVGPVLRGSGHRAPAMFRVLEGPETGYMRVFHAFLRWFDRSRIPRVGFYGYVSA